jgi:uncharacterized protein (TIGR02599 family)
VKQKRQPNAFTLVELLVACTVLLILVVALGQMASQASSILRKTTSRTEQFREARSALDSIQQTLSQATLNTYWDYTRVSSTAPPTGYMRQSDLRFISGSYSDLGLGAGSVSHGAFFLAPLGYVTSTATYGSLHGLLNTCGYYVAFNSDASLLPSFFSSAIAPRYRYRLMELRQPADSLTIYTDTSGANSSGQLNASTYTGKDWYQTPITQGSPQILAENIVALIILPELSQADQTAKSFTASSLAPTYLYDSSTTGQKSVNTYLNSSNQLPPVVQVTIVAIDETSAQRIANGSTAPNLGVGGLFTEAANYQADLDQLQANLLFRTFTDGTVSYTPQGTAHPSLNYHIFTTKFNLLASKWSITQ